MSRAGASPKSPTSRSRISPVALLVNVTHITRQGGTPSLVTSWAALYTITRVLPEPAPAKTSIGPSVWVIASSWRSLSDWRRSRSIGVSVSSGRLVIGVQDVTKGGDYTQHLSNAPLYV